MRVPTIIISQKLTKCNPPEVRILPDATMSKGNFDALHYCSSIGQLKLLQLEFRMIEERSQQLPSGSALFKRVRHIVTKIVNVIRNIIGQVGILGWEAHGLRTWGRR